MSWIPESRPDSDVALTDSDRSWLVGDIRDGASTWRAKAPARSRVQLLSGRPSDVARALHSLEGWLDEVHLVPTGMQVSTLPQLGGLDPDAGNARSASSAEDRGVSGDAIQTRWVLYTSGTTGQPKAISHWHGSLTRSVRESREGTEFTWGLLYEPFRMAGLQVIAQGLASGGEIVAPGTDLDLVDSIRFMRNRGVNALSATPTLWRRILQTPASSGWPLDQITLGGEVADQRVIDALQLAFPEAHVTHVFASTETGAAFAVGDGREGFPSRYLSEPPRGVRLAVRDGILYVHSPGVQGSGNDGFASTGDVVELLGDRVFFRGRESGQVNVGGAKVWPEEVEATLRRHDEVVDAVVTARANPFSGAILVAQVVAAAEAGADLDKRLRSWMRSQAPSHHVPATIRVVQELQVSSNGKVSRR